MLQGSGLLILIWTSDFGVSVELVGNLCRESIEAGEVTVTLFDWVVQLVCEVSRNVGTPEGVAMLMVMM